MNPYLTRLVQRAAGASAAETPSPRVAFAPSWEIEALHAADGQEALPTESAEAPAPRPGTSVPLQESAAAPRTEAPLPERPQPQAAVPFLSRFPPAMRPAEPTQTSAPAGMRAVSAPSVPSFLPSRQEASSQAAPIVPSPPPVNNPADALQVEATTPLSLAQESVVLLAPHPQTVLVREKTITIPARSPGRPSPAPPVRLPPASLPATATAETHFEHVLAREVTVPAKEAHAAPQPQPVSEPAALLQPRITAPALRFEHAPGAVPSAQPSAAAPVAPGVRVQIGKVEVRVVREAPPEAPARAPIARGFDEYLALRSYQESLW